MSAKTNIRVFDGAIIAKVKLFFFPQTISRENMVSNTFWLSMQYLLSPAEYIIRYLFA